MGLRGWGLLGALEQRGTNHLGGGIDADFCVPTLHTPSPRTLEILGRRVCWLVSPSPLGPAHRCTTLGVSGGNLHAYPHMLSRRLNAFPVLVSSGIKKYATLTITFTTFQLR
jgi:hypothetical protein